MWTDPENPGKVYVTEEELKRLTRLPWVNLIVIAVMCGVVGVLLPLLLVLP